MKILGNNTVEDIQKEAMDMLRDVELVGEILSLNCPGHFVFSPGHHRIVVGSMEELHEARKVLREKYGWRDTINNKFFSCGVAIATYRPDSVEGLPFPMELWVEATPEKFPTEILGECKLVPITRHEYNIVCEVQQ